MTRNEDDTPTFSVNIILKVVYGFLIAYFGLLGLILLDEVVFKTFFFMSSSLATPTVVDCVRVIYWPILKLLQFL